jgi:hypothetical protein
MDYLFILTRFDLAIVVRLGENLQLTRRLGQHKGSFTHSDRCQMGAVCAEFEFASSFGLRGILNRDVVVISKES